MLNSSAPMTGPVARPERDAKGNIIETTFQPADYTKQMQEAVAKAGGQPSPGPAGNAGGGAIPKAAGTPKKVATPTAPPTPAKKAEGPTNEPKAPTRS